MENKEFIMELILTIEDFNNVDPKLMNIINSDKEYRRIFEEYREISALTSECIPVPKKNGISLHDAVMTRVRNGDTAPRYINTSSAKRFMFPMATAASLAIVLVVAVIAVTVTRTRRNDTTNDWVVYESEGYSHPMPGGAYFAPPAPASQGSDTFPSNDGAVANTYHSHDDVHTDSSIEDHSEYRDTDSEKAATYDAANGTAYSTELPSFEQTPENAQEAETKSAEKGVSAEESADEYSDDEILSRLSAANSKGISEVGAITVEDIEVYGKENFIAWFDSIADAENFTELYSKKQFIRYCAEQAKTE